MLTWFQFCFTINAFGVIRIIKCRAGSWSWGTSFQTWCSTLMLLLNSLSIISYREHKESFSWVTAHTDQPEQDSHHEANISTSAGQTEDIFSGYSITGPWSRISILWANLCSPEDDTWFRYFLTLPWAHIFLPFTWEIWYLRDNSCSPEDETVAVWTLDGCYVNSSPTLWKFVWQIVI